MQQAQQQPKQTSPMAAPKVQPKASSTNPVAKTNVQPNPQNQQTQQGVPMKKHSKWWLWMLIGFVLGALISWVYFGVLA